MNLEEEREAELEKWLEDKTLDELKNEYINGFGILEVLDRLFIANYNFVDFIEDHPIILLSSRLYKLANEIETKLAELYQEINREYQLPDQINNRFLNKLER